MVFGRREVLIPNFWEKEYPIKVFTSNLCESHWKSWRWENKELSWNLCATPWGIFNGHCPHSIHTIGFLFLPSWSKCVSRTSFQTGLDGRPAHGSELIHCQSGLHLSKRYFLPIMDCFRSLHNLLTSIRLSGLIINHLLRCLWVASASVFKPHIHDMDQILLSNISLLSEEKLFSTTAY